MKKAAFVGLGLMFCIAAPAFSQSYLNGNNAVPISASSIHKAPFASHVENTQTTTVTGRICKN